MQGEIKRFKQHVGEAKRGCQYLLEKSMRKWGAKYFTICTIVDGIHSWKEANRLETLWIKRLRSNDRSIGYNMTAGGEGIRDPDGSVRKKLSIATKKHLGGDPKRNPAYRHDVPIEDLLEMRRQRVPVEKMAQKYGVSLSLVYRRFKKLGVPTIPNLQNHDAEIAELYLEEGYTTTEVASLIKASPGKVHRSLVRQGIPLRPSGSIPRRALKTEKKCPGCGIVKPMSEYNKNRASSDRHTNRCRDCENKSNREAKKKKRQEIKQGTYVRKFPDRLYVADRTEKNCCRCQKMFSLEDYTKDKQSPDGRGAYCPECRTFLGKQRWARSKKEIGLELGLESEQTLNLGDALLV
jgi:hypothetical protein